MVKVLDMEHKFISFSTEACAPAGYFLMKLLVPVEVYFQKNHTDKSYSDIIDEFFICPVCTTEDMIKEGFYHERKYVSHKKRYADVRLQIEYEPFVANYRNTKVQVEMIWAMILQAIAVVQRKDSTLKGQELTADLKAAFQHLYPDTFSDEKPC